MINLQLVKTITISKEQLEDLISCAIEGGSNYWYRIESDTKGDYLKTALTDGLRISNYMISGEDADRVGTLDLESMGKALRLLEASYPHIFKAVLDENIDAGDADVFLQLALFGKVLYG